MRIIHTILALPYLPSRYIGREFRGIRDHIQGMVIHLRHLMGYMEGLWIADISGYIKRASAQWVVRLRWGWGYHVSIMVIISYIWYVTYHFPIMHVVSTPSNKDIVFVSSPISTVKVWCTLLAVCLCSWFGRLFSSVAYRSRLSKQTLSMISIVWPLKLVNIIFGSCPCRILQYLTSVW